MSLRFFRPLSRTALRNTLSNSKTTARTMATRPNDPASQAISETARAEGGPTKNSTSAQMQSQVDKSRNFEAAAQEVGAKMAQNPGAVTSEDANHLKRREARVLDQAQPPSGSISSQAQSLASANEEGTTPRTAMSTGAPVSNPTQQSQADRLDNFDQAASAVGEKMASHPEQVNQQDASLLHSREHRAFGETSKGGISAQAQSLASANESGTTPRAATGATSGTTNTSPTTQSQADRIENFEEAAAAVRAKAAADPEHVDKDDAGLLHSREQRAYGETSKGGITSQAHSLASENEKKGNT